jgi:Uma2 family endonuclease
MPERRLFTVDEYMRMIDAGILREGERVELIEGEILQMAAMGSKHIGCLVWHVRWWSTNVAGRALLTVQTPLVLGPNNEPEPDVLLMRPRDDLYRNAKPGAEDALLVIEIADTSLRYDREVKQQLYAGAGIREFWIVDLLHLQVLVHREPQGELYNSVQTFKPGSEITPLAFPDLSVPVDGILG